MTQSEAAITASSARRRAVPFLAPHFALIAKRRAEALGLPADGCVRTTLDLNIQRISERALAESVANLAGVNGAAVVVIENRRGAVRALVGSPDFFDDSHQGQVDCATAKRSPGSTLKPFLYAMVFDSGDAIPATRLADTPVSFSGYRPTNYDGKYHGIVSVREALVYSYNIPAVRLLRKEGVRAFIGKLRECGLRGFSKTPESYGLSLILGGARVNLLELTSAYTVFPNNGVARRFRILENEPQVEQSAFSAATADMITDILRDSERVAGRGMEGIRSGNGSSAWKTGTSHGFKDAWTVGYDGEHTVGVWLGNPDGSASKRLVGIESAAPLCLEIINRISSGQDSSALTYSAGLTETDVCAESGMVAGPLCENVERGLVNSRIRYEKCDLCGRGKSRKPRLSILSPSPGRYLARSVGKPLKLKCQSTGGVGKRYWFVDDGYFGASNCGGALFWRVEQGRHKITCVDDSGERSSVEITVDCS